MKLSVYAHPVGVFYCTTFRWYKSGKIKGRQLDAGTLPITEPIEDLGISQRPKLLKLLNDPVVTLIVVEHKERLTRLGYTYIEQLLRMQNRRVEVRTLAENGKEDLVQDFVSSVISFCAQLYGQPRSKRKTERIIHRQGY